MESSVQHPVEALVDHLVRMKALAEHSVEALVEHLVPRREDLVEYSVEALVEHLAQAQSLVEDPPEHLSAYPV